MAVLTPSPKMQFFDINGEPLVGGKVYTYLAGTATPQATYTDNTGATANPNPVILNARGEASIWLSGANFKFKLTDANDVEIWTVDYISAPISGVSPALSGNVTIDTSSSSPALKITQTGTGLALRVQDEADPDSTPTVVDNQGRLGVGTASPSEKVDISGGNLAFTAAAGTLYAKVTPGASLTDIAADGARALSLSTNSTPRINITSGGLVGIGKTPSAGVELDVLGDIASSATITATTSVITDIISERTAAAGVTIDGVLVKDSAINAAYTPLSLATTQNTVSAAVDFNDIPSWAQRITVIFNAVGINGTTTGIAVYLGTGTSGSPVFVTSGYASTSAQLPNAAAIVATGSTAGFYAFIANASFLLSGHMVITRMGASNIYVASWTFGTAAGACIVGGGTVTLGAVTTQLRVDAAGVNNFNGGSVNILYE
jgi:hypothetical protein